MSEGGIYDRFDQLNQKIDAIGTALVEFIEHASLWFPTTSDGSNQLDGKTHEVTFKHAVGIADKLRESID